MINQEVVNTIEQIVETLKDVRDAIKSLKSETDKLWDAVQYVQNDVDELKQTHREVGF